MGTEQLTPRKNFRGSKKKEVTPIKKKRHKEIDTDLVEIARQDNVPGKRDKVRGRPHGRGCALKQKASHGKTRLRLEYKVTGGKKGGYSPGADRQSQKLYTTDARVRARPSWREGGNSGHAAGGGEAKKHNAAKALEKTLDSFKTAQSYKKPNLTKEWLGMGRTQ